MVLKNIVKDSFLDMFCLTLWRDTSSRD